MARVYGKKLDSRTQGIKAAKTARQLKEEARNYKFRRKTDDDSAGYVQCESKGRVPSWTSVDQRARRATMQDLPRCYQLEKSVEAVFQSWKTNLRPHVTHFRFHRSCQCHVVVKEKMSATATISTDRTCQTIQVPRPPSRIFNNIHLVLKLLCRDLQIYLVTSWNGWCVSVSSPSPWACV